LIKNKKQTRIIIPFGLLIVTLIIAGTFDLFYGNGVLGLLLYGVALVALSGFSYGLNIFTGLGLVSRHKRDKYLRTGNKPRFTFTIDSETTSVTRSNEIRNAEIQKKSNKEN
jgi:hypothetical protein